MYQSSAAFPARPILLIQRQVRLADYPRLSASRLHEKIRATTQLSVLPEDLLRGSNAGGHGGLPAIALGSRASSPQDISERGFVTFLRCRSGFAFGSSLSLTIHVPRCWLGLTSRDAPWAKSVASILPCLEPIDC
jgi:hypothetical protein